MSIQNLWNWHSVVEDLEAGKDTAVEVAEAVMVVVDAVAAADVIVVGEQKISLQYCAFHLSFRSQLKYKEVSNVFQLSYFFVCCYAVLWWKCL